MLCYTMVIHEQRIYYRKTLMSNFKVPECTNCHSTNITIEETEIYCNECGLVLAGQYEIQDGVKTVYPFGYII